MRKIGYGVLGLGIGTSHVRSAVQAEHCDFVAICDANIERLNKVGDKYGILPENRYTSYEEMLARKDIDIVSVCSPSGMHRDHTVMALRAGKHVLTEKPLEITLERIDEMIRVAEEEHRYLGCIFQTRLHAGNQKIKQTLDSSRMGKMVTCNFEMKWYREDAYYASAGGWRGTWAFDGGGAIMNQAIHTVDLMQWMMGPVKSIFAKAGTFTHNIEAEDTAVAVVEFASGAIGSLIGTTSAYPGLDVTLQIHGSNGSISSRNGLIEVFKMRDDEGFVEEKQVIAEFGPGCQVPNPGHAAQVQDMINAVIEQRSPMLDGHEGRKAVEVITALYESARTGREVFL